MQTKLAFKDESNLSHFFENLVFFPDTSHITRRKMTSDILGLSFPSHWARLISGPIGQKMFPSQTALSSSSIIDLLNCKWQLFVWQLSNIIVVTVYQPRHFVWKYNRIISHMLKKKLKWRGRKRDLFILSHATTCTFATFAVICYYSQVQSS